MPARKIARSIHEAARDKARAIAKTEAYAVSRRERKKVEMLFTHLKRIPFGRHRQNLRKLAKLIPFQRQSSPFEAKGLNSTAPIAAATAFALFGVEGSSTQFGG
jgi:hypothetical protein